MSPLLNSDGEIPAVIAALAERFPPERFTIQSQVTLRLEADGRWRNARPDITIWDGSVAKPNLVGVVEVKGEDAEPNPYTRQARRYSMLGVPVVICAGASAATIAASLLHEAIFGTA